MLQQRAFARLAWPQGDLGPVRPDATRHFDDMATSRKGSRGNGTSYGLLLRCVVRGTYKTRARGGKGSWRETMTTGRVLAARPKSANQISPGWGFIEQVEDLLFDGARARDVKDIVIGEFYDLSDALPGFCRRLRLPLAQSSIQFLRQGVHGDLLPSLLVYAIGRPSIATYSVPGAWRPQSWSVAKTAGPGDLLRNIA